MAVLATQAESFSHIAIPPKAGYRYHVVTDLDAFLALKPRWDDFLKVAGILNLCMTHGFLTRWISHFKPEQLCVVIVEDTDGNWMGLAPLQIHPSRVGISHRMLRHLQWIGTQPTVFDWMQFAIHPQADERETIHQIADALKEQVWDLLDLQFGLDDQQLKVLAAALDLQPISEKNFWKSSCIPYIALPETVEAYESMRRKKTRLEVNRHKNNIKKTFEEPLLLELKTWTPDLEPALGAFFDQHICYWAERGFQSDFRRYPVLRQFYRDLLIDAGPAMENNVPHLIFSILTLGQTELSYHFGFWQGDKYLAHITSYNPDFKKYGPGTVHMDQLVFEMLNWQSVEFEFGRGDEAYKKLWTETKKPLWNLRMPRTQWATFLWEVDVWLKKRLGKICL